MRILIGSKFLHYVGGVETYVRWLAWSLAEAGHEVGLVGMAPPEAKTLMDLPEAPMWLTASRSFEQGSQGRLRSAALSVWSPEAARVMRQALHEFQPDLMHLHGTCYQLTPSVVSAGRRFGVPIAMTAHEHKLICANQTLIDDRTGVVCTACVGLPTLAKAKHIVTRSCMKGSKAVSALGALEQQISEPVWRRADPLILAPSQFMRDTLISDGWNADRIHYLDLPWRREHDRPQASDGPRDGVLFLARLAQLKGPHRLLTAWSRVAGDYPALTLRLAGDGELRSELEARVSAERLPRVEFLGHCTADQLAVELDRAVISVHPSQCMENSPFSVRESLMRGVPALVSRVGGMQAMVSDATGWTVTFDDDDAWEQALRVALDSNLAGSPDLLRAVEVRSMTEEAHVSTLESLYAAELARG